MAEAEVQQTGPRTPLSQLVKARQKAKALRGGFDSGYRVWANPHDPEREAEEAKKERRMTWLKKKGDEIAARAKRRAMEAEAKRAEEAEARRLEEEERERVQTAKAAAAASKRAEAEMARREEMEVEEQAAARRARRAAAQSKRAAMFERAQQRALLEAQSEEKARAVTEARQRKWRFPELVRLANEYNVSGEKVTRPNMGWLELFSLIAEEVPESLMVVDMEVDGLPLQYTNPAATKLTGYPREEMLGRNCRFLRHDEVGRFQNGREQTAPELRAIRRSITDGRPVALKVVNYRKGGSAFENILSLHPVYHASTHAYCYSIGLQSEYLSSSSAAERVAQQERLEKLRGLLPTEFISDADATRYEQAAAADAVSVGEIAQLKFATAMQRETLVTLTRLACALDGPAALVRVLSLEAARHAFRDWLTERLHDGKRGAERLACLERLSSSAMVGNASSGASSRVAPLALDRAAAAAALADAAPLVSDEALPRFLASKSATPLLEDLVAVEQGCAATKSGRLWKAPPPPPGAPPPLLPSALYQHIALGLALPIMFTLADPSTGAVLFANDAYCRATAQAPAEVLGTHWRGAHCTPTEPSLLAAHAQAQALLESAMADGVDCVLDLGLQVSGGAAPGAAPLPVVGGVRVVVPDEPVPADGAPPPRSLCVALYVERPQAAEAAAATARKLAKVMKLLPELDPPACG